MCQFLGWEVGWQTAFILGKNEARRERETAGPSRRTRRTTPESGSNPLSKDMEDYWVKGRQVVRACCWWSSN